MANNICNTFSFYPLMEVDNNLNIVHHKMIFLFDIDKFHFIELQLKSMMYTHYRHLLYMFSKQDDRKYMKNEYFQLTLLSINWLY
ncbi:unnamed protein product [Paramecium pentaurelia]|uniref:Uncharacterized protein n=1 Tax=Paramecium pentaurelia TaxID=43138 RepID=A0A8S1SQ55_9CILI|nr:unnamed protein product [Paramecium pentaurelia]